MPTPHKKIMEAWNEMARANGLRTILAMSLARKEMARIRWRQWAELHAEGAWGFFREILAAIPRSPFLMGDNDRGWKVTFKFVMRNDHHALRIVEGAYEHENGPMKWL